MVFNNIGEYVLHATYLSRTTNETNSSSEDAMDKHKQITAFLYTEFSMVHVKCPD